MNYLWSRKGFSFQQMHAVQQDTKVYDVFVRLEERYKISWQFQHMEDSSNGLRVFCVFGKSTVRAGKVWRVYARFFCRLFRDRCATACSRFRLKRFFHEADKQVVCLLGLSAGAEEVQEAVREVIYRVEVDVAAERRRTLHERDRVVQKRIEHARLLVREKMRKWE